MKIPEILKPQYYFDSSLVEYGEVFKGARFAWEAVRRLQGGTLADRIARGRCRTVERAGKPLSAVSASGAVRVYCCGKAAIGPVVTIIGKAGGLVCIDKGAKLLPGTVISAGRNAVYIGKNVSVGPNAHIDAGAGSICIGSGAVLGQGAYVRGLSLISSGAVIGNSSEIKCSLVGREAEVPHFNYVGDSILGWKAHLGAGVKLSNLKIMPAPGKKDTVKIRHDGAVYDTGLRKFGAIIGDRTRIGCNSVCNPGTLIGRHTVVYTGSNLIGIVPAHTIMKLRQTFERVDLRKQDRVQ